VSVVVSGCVGIVTICSGAGDEWKFGSGSVVACESLSLSLLLLLFGGSGKIGIGSWYGGCLVRRVIGGIICVGAVAVGVE